MQRLTLLLIPVICWSAPFAAWAKTKNHKAHAHGHAKASIVVDGKNVAVEIEIPGDGIFGFEHLPKTATEKQLVKDGLATLRDKATEVIVFPSASACKETHVKVESSLENSSKEHGDHADVEVEYRFACAQSPAGDKATLGLLKLFPRIKEVDVQVVSGDKQAKVEVTNDKDPIGL